MVWPQCVARCVFRGGDASLALLVLQYRATKKIPSAHGDSVWSVGWLAADRLMTGSLDEVVKTWCVWGAVRRRRRGGAHVAVGNV
jgi:hypothetical protein